MDPLVPSYSTERESTSSELSEDVTVTGRYWALFWKPTYHQLDTEDGEE